MFLALAVYVTVNALTREARLNLCWEAVRLTLPAFPLNGSVFACMGASDTFMATVQRFYAAQLGIEVDRISTEALII